ncbi:nitroreductase [Fulvimarina sp. 2208YS6-2-32]|uniref:Putative NAD(P)H nitroreductase n=1 Tax=Fulvimarina uroteuthidis TaxID=3098149 RepID=A0ABU5HYH4_9HYPH|nr:nitroreductase [Fulvimarina sp. 2208YS6-2-32]MDY8108011.1 nitroreductase [Fulvimarina sp. 2208YS6-2-32]
MPDLLAHLTTRRSLPLPALVEPGPSTEQLNDMLTIAVRVPDHGKLAPWRFILFSGDGAVKAGAALGALVARREGPLSETRQRVEDTRFTRAPLVVAVVSTAADHVKIPIWEQQLSAGAVCLNLIHGANAKGFAATWLTEWPAYDIEAKALLGIAPHEAVAGFIHIGTPGEPPSERPRPALADLVSVYDGGTA